MSTTNSIENLGLAEKKSSLLNPKIVFNTKWDRDLGGIRLLELDALKSSNSNINNVLTTLGNPIDNNTAVAKTTPSLFFARTRLIKLIDVWNRILNSGLFTTSLDTNGNGISTYKLIGSNFPSVLGDYLFRNLTGSFVKAIDFNVENIFNRITRFLVAYVNNYNWYVLNNVNKQSLFTLTTAGTSKEFHSYINVNFNPTSSKAINLMDELLGIYKELISETLVSEKLLCTFETLTFSTGEGRANILKLDTYKSSYKDLAKISEPSSLFATGGLLDFLSTEAKTLVQEWITTNSDKVKLLYPQFATPLTRNTENETWTFRNVLVKTTSLIGDPSLDRSTNDPLSNIFGDIYLTKYVGCTQLDMKKPLVLGSSQFIDWSNPNDRPYIMIYNGGTLIYIPDEIKDLSLLQPDNQINIAANFWKIGTSNDQDPNYDASADVKLKLPVGKNLRDIDKIDYLDNLTLYLKLN